MLGELLIFPEVRKEADALLAGLLLVFVGQVSVLVLHELRDRIKCQRQELLVEVVLLARLRQKVGRRGEVQEDTYDRLPILHFLML